jgi:hypothetical protein
LFAKEGGIFQETPRIKSPPKDGCQAGFLGVYVQTNHLSPYRDNCLDMVTIKHSPLSAQPADSGIRKVAVDSSGHWLNTYSFYETWMPDPEDGIEIW